VAGCAPLLRADILSANSWRYRSVLCCGTAPQRYTPPAPLLPPGSGLLRFLYLCLAVWRKELFSTPLVFQLPLLLPGSSLAISYPDGCRLERDIYMLNASSLRSIFRRYLDIEKGLCSAQVVSVDRAPPKLTCSTTPGSFTAVSVEALQAAKSELRLDRQILPDMNRGMPVATCRDTSRRTF
jgi:hypothetical protein